MIYSQLYRQVLWPAYEKLRGRHTHDYFRQVERNQWLPAQAVADQQWEALLRLVRHAYDQSPWYRTRFDQAGLRPDQIRSLADFRRIPPITKQDIRQHRAAMVAENYRDRVYEHKTGGSTGTPLQFFMTRESYEWRNAVMLRGYGWAGAADGVKTFYLWGVPLNNPTPHQRRKAALHDWIQRRKIYNSYRLTPDTLPDCLRELNEFAPQVLVGYTSMLEYLARYIRKNGGLRVKLHSVITSAEGVSAAQRDLFRETFQAPVFHSYGSREFKLIAMDCEHGGLHLSADNLLVECLRNGRPAQPGEMGAVVITDLHNYGMPFIRYEIGDLATPSDKPCACGRGLPLLDAVAGRIPDTIQTPEGRLIHGTFFGQLLMWFPCIDHFQVTQKSLTHLHVRLVAAQRDTAVATLPKIKSKMQSVLGETISIEFEFCDVIPPNAAGKHRFVISEIPVNI